MMQYDVVIVGAGPVGAATAILLAQQQLKVLILERFPTVLEIPRAIGLDEDAQRILQACELPKHVIDTWVAVPYAVMESPYVGPFISFDMRGSANGHPRLTMIFQPELEKGLRQVLARYSNVTLVTHKEFETYAMSAEGVVINYRDFDPAENKAIADSKLQSVTARYLIGADGANSKVRTQAGIEFEHLAESESWLVIDVRNPSFQPTHLVFVCDPQQPAVYMPAPHKRVRWEFMLRHGQTNEYMLQDSTIKKLLAPWGNTEQMDIERKAIYSFKACVARSLSKDKLFLVGDAAHLTPPFAGQGLCGGLRDAYNLAWKLGAVIRGQAHESLLRTYHQERHKHIRDIVLLAVYMGKMIMPTSRLFAVVRDYFIKISFLIKPLKDFVEVVNLKPGSAFKRGFFLPSQKIRPRIKSGDLFPQTIVANSKNELIWLDDLLGPKLTLVGMGLNAEKYVSQELLQQWQQLGGQIAWVVHKSQRIEGQEHKLLIQDMTNEVYLWFAKSYRFAIVRPDRVVMAVFSEKNAEKVLTQVIERFH